MTDHKYKTAWCDFVAYLMRHRGLNQTDFADKLEVPRNSLHQWVTGRSKPPVTDLERWVEVLRLNDTDADRFRWLAMESYTPAAVWSRLRDLERTVDDLADKLRKISIERDEIREHLVRLREKFASPAVK